MDHHLHSCEFSPVAGFFFLLFLFSFHFFLKPITYWFLPLPPPPLKCLSSSSLHYLAPLLATHTKLGFCGPIPLQSASDVVSLAFPGLVSHLPLISPWADLVLGWLCSCLAHPSHEYTWHFLWWLHWGFWFSGLLSDLTARAPAPHILLGACSPGWDFPNTSPNT